MTKRRWFWWCRICGTSSWCKTGFLALAEWALHNTERHGGSA